MMDGKSFIKDIIGHRGNGNKTEVEVLWSSGIKQWLLLDTKLRREYEIGLVNYALQNELLDQNGWKWIKAKELVTPTYIIKITSHHKKDGKLEAEMLFWDGSKDWDTVENIEKDPEDVHLLREYANANGLSKTKGWMALCRKKEERDWFDDVQDTLSDVKQLWTFKSLTRNLHSSYKKHKNLYGEDDTSIALGKAFKIIRY